MAPQPPQSPPNGDIRASDDDSSEATRVAADADENTLLLAPSADTFQKASDRQRDDTPSSPTPDSDAAAAAAAAADNDDPPFPTAQILLLCYARLVEPIAFFSIFPYVNAMIYRLGRAAVPPLPESDVGFWSGAIESLFSLTQMLLMIPWGRLADRVGRKPVLVFSLVGLSVATPAFGLSERVWVMVATRCVAGSFAGSIVTIRTMMQELSTKRSQARVMSWFAFSGNLGIFLGPIVGGALADVGGGNVKLLRRFPYLLPNLVTGLISLSAAGVCAWLVKETLRREEDGKADRLGQGEGEGEGETEGPMSTWEVLKAPAVAPVLFLYGHIMLLAFSYTAVAPVFYFTSVELGGWGLSPRLIMLFICIGGASQSVWILAFFPWLQRRFGTGWVLRACAVAYPFFFALQPVGNVLLRRGHTTAFWVLAPPSQILGTGVSMCFTAIQLALNDVAPSPQSLGTLNAAALAFIAGIRAFAPALFTSLFAMGVRTQILDGYLIWVIMVVVAAALNGVLRWLPERAEGKVKGR